MSQDVQPDFTLEHIFDNMVELPTFPKVVQDALKMLDDPNTTVDELAEVLKYDPAITANIIKMTNSAHFGLPQQVASVETALALLGHKQIRQILMASASLPYLTRPLYGYDITPDKLWSHSISTAIISEVVAEGCGVDAGAEYFTAALLHDVGKIVLHIYVGGRLDEIAALASQEKITFPEAEWKVLGGDHAVIGSELLRIWEFPNDIVRAIRCHHDPDLYVQRREYAVVAMSNFISSQLGIGVGNDSFLNRINPQILEALGLNRSDYHEIVVKSILKCAKAKDLFMLYKEAGSELTG